MLRWCSYCQNFLGEGPRYDDFRITHGACTKCEGSMLQFSESDAAGVRILQDIQNRLRRAGENGDAAAAAEIIAEAAKSGVREVDILIGVLAPLLYEIGEDWKQGRITVAYEHRFTAFCENLFDRIVAPKARFVAPAEWAVPLEPRIDFLLASVAGNAHSLGVRVLALWLCSQGVRAHVIHPPSSTEELVRVVTATRPRKVLVSMALAEQRPGVVDIVERMAALPEDVRPVVVVGGYAVKVGLVEDIPGAVMTADIASL